MRKDKFVLTIGAGILCVLALVASSWYALTFNDGRLVVPTDFATYTFQARDLPMIVSLSLVLLYALYLGVLLIKGIIAKKQKQEVSNTTRKLDPRLGLLGFLGFAGFAGFWTYSAEKVIFPFAFFLFFGFFGFFYEGKMSDTFMDERYEENRIRAQFNAHRVSLAIIFLSIVLIGHGALLGNLEYTLIALCILVSLALALDVFLGEYLLYRYDHDDQAGLEEE